MSSRLCSSSEASASELLQCLRDMFSRYYISGNIRCRFYYSNISRRAAHPCVIEYFVLFDKQHCPRCTDETFLQVCSNSEAHDSELLQT